ncbi:MAG: carbohydrate ABC transporter permease [Anaerolineae bacterium]|nr:carbohydrate ABC transporter permease [Anaerolineae bacterium]MCA9910211.1 carbohydrate ABC transporter permease [Anaerolineae bacterium]
MTRASGWRKTAYHLLLWLVVLIFFAPVAWIILSAFKTTNQILAIPPLVVFEPTLDNFRQIAADPNAGRFLWNSLWLSIIAVLIALAVSFLAAYAFSRFNLKTTNFLMFVLLSMRMVPAVAVVIPLYLMYSALGWRNQPLAMLAFYAMFSIPFSVWILKGFVDGVSRRFDETALVNGGSRWHVLFRVVLPQIGPGLVAAFIFNMIFVWNEFLFNLLLGGRDVTNIPVFFSTDLYSDGGMNWTFIAAMTTVYIIPPMIIIYLFQRYLLVGMTFGTVRGEV